MRKVIIRRSLIRPHLILGCERIPVFLLAVVSAIIAIELNIFSILFGVSLWVFGFFTLRKIGKSDPYLFGKFIKFNRYGSFYVPFEREVRD